MVINSSIGIWNIALMMQNPHLSEPGFLIVNTPILCKEKIKILGFPLLVYCFVEFWIVVLSTEFKTQKSSSRWRRQNTPLKNLMM